MMRMCSCVGSVRNSLILYQPLWHTRGSSASPVHLPCPQCLWPLPLPTRLFRPSALDLRLLLTDRWELDFLCGRLFDLFDQDQVRLCQHKTFMNWQWIFSCETNIGFSMFFWPDMQLTRLCLTFHLCTRCPPTSQSLPPLWRTPLSKATY